MDINDTSKQKSNDLSKDVSIRTLLKQDKKPGAVKRKAAGRLEIITQSFINQ
jgi:hypothetical protein